MSKKVKIHIDFNGTYLDPFNSSFNTMVVETKLGPYRGFPNKDESKSPLLVFYAYPGKLVTAEGSFKFPGIWMALYPYEYLRRNMSPDDLIDHCQDNFKDLQGTYMRAPTEMELTYLTKYFSLVNPSVFPEGRKVSTKDILVFPR